MQSTFPRLFLLLVLTACRSDSEEAEEAAEAEDLDLDGQSDENDCDDNDPTVNTYADEVCDGKDNNCDGIIDGVDATDASIWYFDQDGDGFGSAAVSRVSCTQPVSDEATGSVAGFVSASGDCDDRDAAIFPGAVEVCDLVDNDCDDDIDEGVKESFYPDRDGDGYGVEDAPSEACTAPTGYSSEKGDCDDSNPSVNVDGTEYCNGFDDDCDGDVDEDDASDAADWAIDRDEDGFGDILTTDPVKSCERPIGHVFHDSLVETDCNDFSAAQAPDRLEVCDDLDNDCDGDVDESDAEDADEYFLDADGDGYANNLGISEFACSDPSDGDAQYLLLEADDLTDCDDDLDTVSPAAAERCDTAYDDDCDGDINESDAEDVAGWYVDADEDGYGWASGTVAACTQPSGFVADNTDCDDSSADAYPGRSSDTDLCDGLDNDCDGTVDGAADGSAAYDATDWYFDYDGDGYGDVARRVTDCSAPSSHVADYSDCDDADVSINPAATEYCNGVDDDCDSDIDESDAADAAIYYLDLDSDGYGDPSGARYACSQPSGTVLDKSDCNDRNATIFPGATELCNGEDDDCDSSTLDPTTTFYLDADGDGFGDPATAVAACSVPTTGGTWVENDADCEPEWAEANPDASEECDGLDNDCDDSVDNVGGYCLETLSLSEVTTFEADATDPSDAGDCVMVSVITGTIAPDAATSGDACGCAFVLDLDVDVETYTPDDTSCSYIENDLRRYDQIGFVDDLSTTDTCGDTTVTVRGLRDGFWRDIATAATLSTYTDGYCETIEWNTTDTTDPEASDTGTPATVSLSLDVIVQVSGAEK